MKTLTLIQQNPYERVGKLWQEDDLYCFAYNPHTTVLLHNFPARIVYKSKALFPFFTNRLPRKSRTDYLDYLGYLGLSGDPSPMQILALSGGRRATDSFRLYCIEHKNYYFVRDMKEPCPSYLDKHNPILSSIKIEKVNPPPAPANFRILCSVMVSYP